jgi:hypothetical protein
MALTVFLLSPISFSQKNGPQGELFAKYPLAGRHALGLLFKQAGELTFFKFVRITGAQLFLQKFFAVRIGYSDVSAGCFLDIAERPMGGRSVAPCRRCDSI